jgi:type VII secretion-associated serine protease mycosin
MRVGSTGRVPAIVRAMTAVVLAVAVAGVGVVASPGVAYADTVRGLQWYLEPLRIPDAQKQSQGQGVVVAVIDSGVDASHPDLAGQVLPGYAIGSGAAADGRSDPDAEHGHGTGMASIIAGKGGGANHELGIAPKAKILPISDGTPAEEGSIALAIRWAADHGAKVINISQGAPADPPPDDEVQAVTYALGKDAVVVASAGNTGLGDAAVIAPANIPGVIAVAGTSKSGAFWSGSVHGPQVVIAAPGEQIIGGAPSAASSNRYLVGDGTSGAAAIVSGVVALIRAKYPQMNAANVINRLLRTAKDLGPAGRDEQYGFGVVDPLAALTASVPEVAESPLLAAGGSAKASAPAAKDSRGGPAISIGVTNTWGAVLQVLLCLLLVALVVFIIVRVSRSSRRRPPAGVAPPGWPTPPGQSGVPGQPGGRPPGPPAGPGHAPSGQSTGYSPLGQQPPPD